MILAKNLTCHRPPKNFIFEEIYFFQESETLTAGHEPCVFEHPDHPQLKIGLAICYDLRFPELSAIMGQRGADVIFFPASFNATTGPLHYDLLGRARALDNQAYVALCAPARNFEDKGGYQGWGHSTIINGSGLIEAQAELRERLIVHEMDLEGLEFQRQGMPYATQKRDDVYRILDLTQEKENN